MDGDEFSARILTDRDEYNVEVRPWTGQDRPGSGGVQDSNTSFYELALVLLLNWWSLIIFILIESQHRARFCRV